MARAPAARRQHGLPDSQRRTAIRQPDLNHHTRPFRNQHIPQHITLTLGQRYTLEITFKNYTPAEALTFLHSIQRVDSHTIRFTAKDMPEAQDFIDFLDHYNPDMTP